MEGNEGKSSHTSLWFHAGMVRAIGWRFSKYFITNTHREERNKKRKEKKTNSWNDIFTQKSHSKQSALTLSMVYWENISWHHQLLLLPIFNPIQSHSCSFTQYASHISITKKTFIINKINILLLIYILIICYVIILICMRV